MFDSSTIVNLFLTGVFKPDSPPTPEEVAKKVGELVEQPIFSHLAPQSGAIVTEILKRITVRIGASTSLDNNENHEVWLPAADKTRWKLWPRLERYLLNKSDFPVTVLAELARSTDDVLGKIESPNRDGAWDRRGLVVGHVQSGKTTHYTALVAKALDSGYRIVIILAGIHNNLRAQTQRRIDEYLIGRDSCAIRQAIRGNPDGDRRTIGVGKADLDRGEIFDNFQIMTTTTADDNGDFKPLEQKTWVEVNDGARLVLVVKKNSGILSGIKDWLFNLMANNGRIPHPTLVIDDEADHASMNSADLGDTPTKINQLIRQLLTCFSRVGLVGYTATPTANIFADPDADPDGSFGPDLFPKSFLVNLKAPENYLGPEKVFGNPGDEDAGIPPRPPLPMHVPVEDNVPWLPERHKKDHEPGPLPASLRKAIWLFLLVTATRVARGHKEFHSSMLVHATRFKAVQGKVKEQIEKVVSDLTSLLTHGSTAKRSELLVELRALWDQELVEKHEKFRSALPDDTDDMPDWDTVSEALVSNASRFKVMAINGESGDVLAYATAKDGLWVISVGGDKLSRGLTLEGLSVSYFLRTSSMQDTLMQMGRWFGYRPGYADLCRVYTNPFLNSAFRETTLGFEEFRELIDEMARSGRTPADFSLRVRQPNGKMLITAANKMRRGTAIDVRIAGELVQSLWVPGRGDKATENRKALETLLADVQGLPDRQLRGKPFPSFVWHGQKATIVLKFLRDYVAYHEKSMADNCQSLIRFIEDGNGKGELTEWCICLVSVGSTRQRVNIAGHDVGLTRRGTLDDDREIYRMKQLAGRIEETVDLSPGEFADAQGRSKVTGDDLPSRIDIREVRQPKRGILLLYPLTRTRDDQQPENPAGEYPLGVCVGFPSRLQTKTLRYVSNAVGLRGLPMDENPSEDWDENGQPVKEESTNENCRPA